MQNDPNDERKMNRNSEESEENGFSQPEGNEDENGAGGSLGTSESKSNSNPGGAGSTGSAANNDGSALSQD